MFNKFIKPNKPGLINVLSTECLNSNNAVHNVREILTLSEIFSKRIWLLSFTIL